MLVTAPLTNNRCSFTQQVLPSVFRSWPTSRSVSVQTVGCKRRQRVAIVPEAAQIRF